MPSPTSASIARRDAGARRAQDVEPALGGALLALLRHQRHHVRLDLARDAHHLVGGGHLEVEHAAHRLAQQAHVAILDVAAIFAQVHGDAVGAGELDERRRPHRIGIGGAARLAQRRDVIDVDVQFHG